MKRLKGGMILTDGVYQPQYKACSGCGIIQPISNFHKQGKDVRRNRCRACCRKRDAIYAMRSRIRQVMTNAATVLDKVA